MLYGRLRTFVLLSSVSMGLVLPAPAWSGDRGFYSVAGDRGGRHHLATLSQQRFGRDAVPLVIMYSDDLEEQEPDFRDSFLQQKPAYQRSRSRAKILHVTREQVQIGEARAARREERMLDQIDSLEFRYNRPNEAYDVRFPSIVYIDSIRK